MKGKSHLCNYRRTFWSSKCNKTGITVFFLQYRILSDFINHLIQDMNNGSCFFSTTVVTCTGLWGNWLYKRIHEAHYFTHKCINLIGIQNLTVDVNLHYFKYFEQIAMLFCGVLLSDQAFKKWYKRYISGPLNQVSDTEVHLTMFKHMWIKINLVWAFRILL